MFAHLSGAENCELSPLYVIRHDIKIAVPQCHFTCLILFHAVLFSKFSSVCLNYKTASVI